MNWSIKHRRINTAVTTILSQHDEDRKWSLYLASVSNALHEEGTFNDFLNRLNTPKNEPPKSTEINIDATLSEADIQKQVDKAAKLLNGFIPS